MAITNVHLRHLSVLIFTLTFVSPASRGERKDPADYPLRIHVFRRSETTFYRQRVAEETKGEGRANLFENGEPHALDFEFDCSKKLQTSSGFETFPAKWKKPQQQLVVLMPEFGKQGSYSTCTFKVQVKDFAYFARNGALNSEPVDAYKKWMVQHDYDPEHGKNTPTPTRESAPVPTPPAPAVPPEAQEQLP